jgi:N utilization substance protein A
VEIVAIAREAGHRTKIAVRSHQQGVNAKGACIGPMGSRVRNVMNELHGEKIDIVDYAEDPADFVANALSPARVSRVHVVDLAAREAQVIVPDYQLSLAIGKEGQNARLAARLTGWRIDIRSDAAPTASPEPASPSASPEPPARPATSVSSPDSAAPASSSVTAASADATGASAPRPEPESSAQVRPGAGEARTR